MLAREGRFGRPSCRLSPHPYPQIVLRSLATMHAAFWNRPPAGCWTDDWSAPRTDPPCACPGAPPVPPSPRARRAVGRTQLTAVPARARSGAAHPSLLVAGDCRDDAEEAAQEDPRDPRTRDCRHVQGMVVLPCPAAGPPRVGARASCSIRLVASHFVESPARHTNARVSRSASSSTLRRSAATGRQKVP